MQLKGMGIFELLSLRAWLEMVYTSGRAYINVNKEQLAKLLEKLGAVDQEILDRVMNDDYVGAFFDENFGETLEKIKSGELDGTEGEEAPE
jgi:hypothetical protein